MFQQLGVTLYTASAWVVPLVIAITFHEASHGYVARLCGDDTAWRLGRVSFNPLKHIDPFGTVVLPALLLVMRSPFLFGYAKPVPVNFRALRHPRRDAIWVAAAGPAMNFALAMLAALAFHLLVYLPDAAAQWLAENLKNALSSTCCSPSSTCCLCRRSMADASRSACCRTRLPCRSRGSSLMA